MDKVFVLQYIAAEEGAKISYRNSTEESRRAQAASRAQARRKRSISDLNPEFGPPDKADNFTTTDSDDDFSPPAKRSISASTTIPKGKDAPGKLRSKVGTI